MHELMNTEYSLTHSKKRLAAPDRRCLTCAGGLRTSTSVLKGSGEHKAGQEEGGGQTNEICWSEHDADKV